jgi:hypothetical protein
MDRGCGVTIVRMGDGSTAAFDGDLFATNSIETRMEVAVAELNERVARVHELVACPTCSMPTGVRCLKMAPGGRIREPFVETKHAHVERLHAAGIYVR